MCASVQPRLSTQLVCEEESQRVHMSEEIDKHVQRRFEICHKLGKGVRSLVERLC